MCTLWARKPRAQARAEQAELADIREQDLDAFMHILNEKNIKGGKCRFEWDFIKKRLKKLPLNGDECMLVLAVVRELAAVLWPVSEGETAHSPEHVLRKGLIELWDSWVEVHNHLTKWDMEEEAAKVAMQKGKDFVKKFADFHGHQAKRFPDYLHLLYQHAGWFWGFDEAGKFVGPPAWWSTTGFEKSHSMHKRKLRYKTCHGMKLESTNADGEKEVITHYPAVYQLFQWRVRMYTWRWRALVMRNEKTLHDITVKDLVDLYSCFDFQASPDDPLTEEELVYMLALPEGSQLHLNGYGKLPADTPVNICVQVSFANQAAVDKITQDGQNKDAIVKHGKLMRRHRADAYRPSEVVQAEKRRRRDAEQERVQQRMRLEGIDMSFM
jgi:hypothetical protein